jgi:aldehyde:ferredoxin oxidoreductase
MKQAGGGRQYLVIDLASEQWEVRLIPDAAYHTHLGGESLALYLWSAHADRDAAAGPLCIACGAFTGSPAICSATLSFAGISPLTHLVESDTANSGFASALVSCGWRAIVITGIARRQMVVQVRSDAVEFVPSDRLIGKTVFETVRTLESEGDLSVLAIGPAGERASLLSCAVNEGLPVERFGFGALLGMKHIKAITADHGPMEFAPVDLARFESAHERLSRRIRSSRFLSRFAVKGLLDIVDVAKEEGFAAVDGCSGRTDPRLFHLGPDECARKFSLDTDTIAPCPIGCRKKVMRPGGEDMPLPDAYGMMALGSNLGNYDVNLVMQWWHQAIFLGLHPVSTGMYLGDVMTRRSSAQEGELFPLVLGDTEAITQKLDAIAKGTIPISREILLAGTAVRGRPMLPVDPRGAWGEALLIGLGEDFPFVPEILLRWLPLASERMKVPWVVLQENLLSVVRSVGMCPYLILPLLWEGPGGTIGRKLTSGLSKVAPPALLSVSLDILAELASSLLGTEITADRLMDVGRRAVKYKRDSNGTEAYPAEIPERYLVDPESNHPDKVTVPYRRLVRQYRFHRALDLAKLGES